MTMTTKIGRQALKPIHPFPARMAPSLVLERLGDLGERSRVLDPMAGSGVVLRHAIEQGHQAVGFDLDPLAVLMSRVWTTPISTKNLEKWTALIVREAKAACASTIELDWIDNEEETRAFVKYWFGEAQRAELRRISYVLNQFGDGDSHEDQASLNLIRLALSRIIVTKEPRASLARDTSHSRPHKVLEESEFHVLPAFEKSIELLRIRLKEQPPISEAEVEWGDARRLETIAAGSIDAVITSPPYLNAIDYLRGHRLALVWLGYKLKQLRHIRSTSIGAERAPDDPITSSLFMRIRSAMGNLDELPNRYRLIIDRYVEDLYKMTSEVARVLRPKGTATLVVGNSCLKGTFIANAAGVAEAANVVGLTLTHVSERALPDNKRYLPVTTESKLGRRMRTETICRFVH